MKTKVIILLSSIFSMSAFAGPILSDNCGGLSLKIKIPTKAGGFYLDSDCKNAYVLPPPKGTAEIASFMSSANLNHAHFI